MSEETKFYDMVKSISSNNKTIDNELVSANLLAGIASELRIMNGLLFEIKELMKR